MSRRRKICLYVALGPALLSLVLLFPIANPGMWDGQTDLRVRFVVRDAVTGVPVPGAVIHIENGPRTFCRESEDRNFDLKTDQAGIAQRLAQHCATYGRLWSIEGVTIGKTWN